MAHAGQRYARYSRAQVEVVLEDHRRHPEKSYRDLALAHGIRARETVRYWIGAYRDKAGIARRRRGRIVDK